MGTLVPLRSRWPMEMSPRRRQSWQWERVPQGGAGQSKRRGTLYGVGRNFPGTFAAVRTSMGVTHRSGNGGVCGGSCPGFAAA